MTDSTPRTPSAPSLPPALAARRWFLIAAPVLAGLLAVGGALADPAVGLDGRELYERYAADPGAVQWKSLSYHFAYALWALVALTLAGLVRRRGSWLANVAGLLAILGISSMPGFLLADFYDSSIGQALGVDAATRVGETMSSMWGLGVLASTGAVGFLLCLPVAVLAAWRAGLLSWWGAAAPVVGVVAGFLAVGANPAGAALLTAGFTVLSLALTRLDPRAWDAAPVSAAGRQPRETPVEI